MATNQLGPLLAYWRNLRGMSQLALATETAVSARHISFVESGRANPSRDMVLLLAEALEVPLRARNALLQAAGFAAVYRESALGEPHLAAVRRALDAILAQHQPFPAVVLDREWNILDMNDAGQRFFAFLLEGSTVAARLPRNVLRLALHPDGLRPRIANWEAFGASLIQRAHREVVGGALDEATRAVIAEVLAYPGVPAAWRRVDHASCLLPVIPVSFEKDGRRFAYFSTVTTLGTPVDVTAQELRIECFFPLDDDTRREAAAFATT